MANIFQSARSLLRKLDESTEIDEKIGRFAKDVGKKVAFSKPVQSLAKAGLRTTPLIKQPQKLLTEGIMSTKARAMQAGEDIGTGLGAPIAGKGAGILLRGAASLTPFQADPHAGPFPLRPILKAGTGLEIPEMERTKQLEEQYQPGTKYEKAIERIGRAGYGLLLGAPIGAGTAAQNISRRAVAGSALSSGIKTAGTLIGEGRLPTKKEFGKAALRGVENSWQLAFTELGTDKIVGILGNKGVLEAGKLKGKGVMQPFNNKNFREGARRVFLREMLEILPENTMFSLTQQLNEEEKKGFVKDWINNLPGAILGNIAFAGARTAVGGGTRYYDIDPSTIKRAAKNAFDTAAQKFDIDIYSTSPGFTKLGPELEGLEAKRKAKAERLEAKTKEGFEPVAKLLDKNRYKTEPFESGSKLEYQSGRLADKYGYERPFVRKLLTEYEPQKIERAMGYVEDAPNKVGNREGYVIDTLRTEFYSKAPDKTKLKGSQSEDYKTKRIVEEEVREPQKPTEEEPEPKEPMVKRVSEEEVEYEDPSQLHSLDVKEAGKKVRESDYFFENYRQRDTHLVTTKNRLFEKYNNPKELLGKIEDDFIDENIQKRETVLEVITGEKSVKELGDELSLRKSQIENVKGLLDDLAYMQDLEERGKYKEEYYPRVFKEMVEEKRMSEIFPESKLQASVKNLHHLEHKISKQLASDVRLDEALDYRINEGLYDIYRNTNVVSDEAAKTPIEQLEGFLGKEIRKASNEGKFKPNKSFEFFTKTQEKMDELGFDVKTKEIDYSYKGLEAGKGDTNIFETIKAKGGEDLGEGYDKLLVAQEKQGAIRQDLEKLDELKTDNQKAAFISRILKKHLGDDPELANSIDAGSILSTLKGDVSVDTIIRNFSGRYKLNRIRDMAIVMSQYDVDGSTSDYFNEFLSRRVAMADIERTWYRTIANFLKGTFSLSFLWGSATTAVRQPLETTKTIAGAGLIETFKGIKGLTPSEVKRIKNVYGQGGGLSETDIAKLTKGDLPSGKLDQLRTVFKKLKDLGFTHIYKLEELKNIYMSKAFEEEGLKRGLEGDKLTSFVINRVNQLGNPHNVETKPNFLRNKPVGELLFQFLEYSLKSLGTAYTTFQKKAYKKAAKLAIAETVNIVAVTNLLGIPVGWATGYSLGFTPIISLISNTWNSAKGIIESRKKGYPTDYSKAQLKDTLKGVLPASSMRGRIAETREAIKQGYATNVVGDRATFKAPETLWQKFKAYAFGLHTTKRSQEYYKKGYKSLDEKITEALGGATEEQRNKLLVEDRERKWKKRKIRRKAEKGQDISQETSTEDFIVYTDSEGDTGIIDFAKINAMPTDGRGETAEKKHKSYLAIRKLVDADESQEKIVQASEKLGIKPENAAYYARASKDVDIKTQYALDDIEKIVESEPDLTQRKRKIIQYLALSRKEVDGEIFASQSVLRDLADMRIITESERKKLNNLKLGEDGSIKATASGRGSDAKIDLVKTSFSPQIPTVSQLSRKRKTSKPSRLIAKNVDTAELSSLTTPRIKT